MLVHFWHVLCVLLMIPFIHFFNFAFFLFFPFVFVKYPLQCAQSIKGNMPFNATKPNIHSRSFINIIGATYLKLQTTILVKQCIEFYIIRCHSILQVNLTIHSLKKIKKCGIFMISAPMLQCSTIMMFFFVFYVYLLCHHLVVSVATSLLF